MVREPIWGEMGFFILCQKNKGRGCRAACQIGSERLESSARGVAQSGSASGLGPEGRRFESCLPDHFPLIY